MHSRRSQRLATFAFVALISPMAAADIIYTFEAPQFAAGETTPLLNRAPNVNTGPASFTASFTTSTPGPFQILDFQANALFTGNSLVDLAPGGDTLTVTFNTLVSQVTFDWGQNAPGTLVLTSLAGGDTEASTPQGGAFQGGAFTFSGNSPFSTFTLQALNAAGAPTEFAVDDLTVVVAVPEPATLALVAMALVGFGWSRRLQS